MNNLKITKIFGFFAVFVFALFLYSVESHAGTFVINDTDGGACSSHDWVSDTKTCTLTGTVTDDVSFADNGITLDCNGNTIDGLGASQNGVSISGRKGVVVKRCIINDWAGTGIVVNNRSSNILLFKNTITNCADGIALFNSVTNSNIIDNVVESSVSGNGFSLTGSSRSNNFINNVSNAPGFGFTVSDSNNNKFIANTASGGTTGFHITLGSSRNDFTYNVSTGNSSRGFTVSAVGRANNFRANIATGNTTFGFFIQNDSDNNTFEDNIADNNTGDGFAQTVDSSNTFINNDCNGNGDNSDPDGLCDEN